MVLPLCLSLKEKIASQQNIKDCLVFIFKNNSLASNFWKVTTKLLLFVSVASEKKYWKEIIYVIVFPR